MYSEFKKKKFEKIQIYSEKLAKSLNTKTRSFVCLFIGLFFKFFNTFPTLLLCKIKVLSIFHIFFVFLSHQEVLKNLTESQFCLEVESTLNPRGVPIFPIKKNTLGQFIYVHFLTVYRFKYTYPISLKKFEKYFKQRRIN